MFYIKSDVKYATTELVEITKEIVNFNGVDFKVSAKLNQDGWTVYELTDDAKRYRLSVFNYNNRVQATLTDYVEGSIKTVHVPRIVTKLRSKLLFVVKQIDLEVTGSPIKVGDTITNRKDKSFEVVGFLSSGAMWIVRGGVDMFINPKDVTLKDAFGIMYVN